jgi:hypothetical protein
MPININPKNTSMCGVEEANVNVRAATISYFHFLGFSKAKTTEIKNNGNTE